MLAENLNMQNRQAAQFLILIVTLALIATGLRFSNLGSDSFWLDEVFTINTANAGLQGGINDLHHPPLYYWLSTAILSVVETNEFALRYVSAVAGILAIPLIALLGKVSGQTGAGLWAAFLLTISPFHIRYSQEARQYAWLMTLSLIGYVMLYLAISRNRLRWWVFFALVTVLNLYTHYGSWLVLGAELLLILIWLTPRFWRHRWSSAVGPVLTSGIILVLYLPWIRRAQEAFTGNIGSSVTEGAGDASSLGTWVRNLFFEFGFRTGALPFLSAALCLTGIIILVKRRQWHILGIVLSILIVPLVLINIFQVGRYAFPKYVVYILPVYILVLGVSLNAFVKTVTSQVPQGNHAGRLIGTLFLSVIIGMVIWPTVSREYEYVERDWRGVVNRLGVLAKNGDIFVPITLDLEDGFNQGYVVAPYYLDFLFDEYTILDGNSLNPTQLAMLSKTDAQVWVLALDRLYPLVKTNEHIVVEPFEGSLYLIYPTSPMKSWPENLELIYSNMVPAATSPAPLCLVQDGQAVLKLVNEEYLDAEEALINSIAGCPIHPKSTNYRLVVASQLFDKIGDKEQTEAKLVIARFILAADRKNQAALKAVTVTDLMQMFLEGQVELSREQLPEPVAIKRFTMPQNGDWGDVILLHPPGSISFEVYVPKSPTALIFRMAMDPASWGWGGDGSTFVVSLQTADGSPQMLFRQHISNNSSDHVWHNGHVSLADYAGQTVKLTLSTESGPAGDGTGDWAGWESPRIIIEP